METIKSKDPLNLDYIPEEIVDREKEIEQIERFLVPVHSSSSTILVHGPGGTGKTTCVKKILQDLEESTTADTVYVDCCEYRTKTAVLVRILIELGLPVPRKGKPVDVLYEKVERQVKKRNLIVALDGINYPGLEKDLVRTIMKLVSRGLSLVLVAVDGASVDELVEELRSRYLPVRVHFEPYTVDELEKILRKRARKALWGDSYSEDSIRRVAEVSHEFCGSCRIALVLLGISARAAEKKDTRLTSGVVEGVAEKLELLGKNGEN